MFIKYSAKRLNSKKRIKNSYVGSMIRRIRDIHGMSRKELGIKAGFNRFTAERKVSLFENDKKS